MALAQWNATLRLHGVEYLRAACFQRFAGEFRSGKRLSNIGQPGNTGTPGPEATTGQLDQDALDARDVRVEEPAGAADAQGVAVSEVPDHHLEAWTTGSWPFTLPQPPYKSTRTASDTGCCTSELISIAKSKGSHPIAILPTQWSHTCLRQVRRRASRFCAFGRHRPPRTSCCHAGLPSVSSPRTCSRRVH